MNSAKTLLARAAERGSNLGAITSALLRLLERNSAADLQAAILEALERDVPIPTPCVWPSNVAANSAAKRHRSASCCPSMCNGATPRLSKYAV